MYTFLQKIKYRWRAHNRHGVHSPFAYNFGEQILHGKLKEEESFFLPEIFNGKLNKKQQTLVSRIVAHFHIQTIVLDGIDIPTHQNESNARLYIFTEKMIAENVENEAIILIPNIYKSKERNANWTNIKNDKNVTLSIDVFEAGLLFFKNDFKVKQHFILRY